MNPIKEVYFFGNNYKAAQIIDRLYSIKRIYCEKRSFNLGIYNFASLHSIEFNLVEAAEDLELVLPKEVNNSLGVSYGFGIIFKKKHIAAFKYGIWNIHPGELPGNRGRHPISWSFLNGCKKFAISIHEINENIDRGYLLSKGYIDRDLDDTQLQIEEKMEKLLESKLIQEAADNYFSDKKYELDKGIYYKSLANTFSSIVPEDYKSAFLFNLFKSQAKYGGVCVKGKRYIDCVFYNENYPKLYNDYDIFICKDGKKVGLK